MLDRILKDNKLNDLLETIHKLTKWDRDMKLTINEAISQWKEHNNEKNKIVETLEEHNKIALILEENRKLNIENEQLKRKNI